MNFQGPISWVIGFLVHFCSGPQHCRAPLKKGMKKGEMHGPDGNFLDSGYGRNKDGNLPDVFRFVHASQFEGPSVCPSVHPSVCPSICAHYGIDEVTDKKGLL